MDRDKLVTIECESGVPPMEEHFKDVTDIVKQLTDGFKSKKWSSHIEPVQLPSRRMIVELIKESQEILFPGYFTQTVLSPGNIEYHLGQKLATLYDILSTEISAAIRHDCLRHNLSCSHCDKRGYEIAASYIHELPRIKELLELDIAATLSGDPAAANADEVIFCYPGLFATLVYRLAHTLIRLEVPIIPRIMSEYAYHRTAIDINPHAKIGNSFFIDHGSGVVVGATTNIGNRVRLYQGVTLGAVSLPHDAGIKLRNKKRHPTIEDDVIIYANATILGGDTVIGARSIIGGNVWLTESVGPDTKVILKQPELIYLGNKKKKGDGNESNV